MTVDRNIFSRLFLLLALLVVLVTAGSSSTFASSRSVDSYGDVIDLMGEFFASLDEYDTDATLASTRDMEVDQAADILNSALNISTSLWEIDPHACVSDLYWAFTYAVERYALAQGMYTAWLVQFEGTVATDDTIDRVWGEVEWSFQQLLPLQSKAAKRCKA